MNAITTRTHQHVGYIAICARAVWGHGPDMAACKADVAEWLGPAGGPLLPDESMRFYKATAMAMAAVEENGADAERSLIISDDETYCYHKAEAAI